MYAAQGLGLAAIAFAVYAMFDCYFIYFWRETTEHFYLGTSIIIAILIILFSIG